MKKYKILIGTPISEYKANVLPKWLSYVKSLVRSYENSKNIELHILLCDNSQNQAFHKQLSRKYNVPVIYSNPMFKNSREFIADSRNRILDTFLQKDYTHFLSLECDIFPHSNFLSTLIAHNKQVIGMPYFIGDKVDSFPMIQILDKIKTYPIETKNISLDEMFLNTGALMKVFNAGLGCTLIKRNVLENIKFRFDNDINLHDDSFFAEDIYLKGISYWLETEHLLRHLNKPWNYFPKNKF
ncbi:MAG: hypothetical protein NT031_03355 [Planctomycetota bacterium]|nr:hypothetical protein [Planctomycetota bacterium]